MKWGALVLLPAFLLVGGPLLAQGEPQEGGEADVSAAVAPEPPPIIKRQSLLSPELRDKLFDRLAEEVRKEAGERTDANDPMAAPGMWVYYVDGSARTDAGGTFAAETWPCRLFRGRSCFAGLAAGKKTAGIAVGAGLRRNGVKGWSAVAWIGWVMLYDSGDSAAKGGPALGCSLKF